MPLCQGGGSGTLAPDKLPELSKPGVLRCFAPEMPRLLPRASFSSTWAWLGSQSCSLLWDFGQGTNSFQASVSTSLRWDADNCVHTVGLLRHCGTGQRAELTKDSYKKAHGSWTQSVQKHKSDPPCTSAGGHVNTLGMLCTAIEESKPADTCHRGRTVTDVTRERSPHRAGHAGWPHGCEVQEEQSQDQ